MEWFATNFFWLLMTLNLFGVGGYFLFSGIGNIGDWAAVVAGWQPAWGWRVGLASVGIVTYFFLFVPLSLRELRPFLGKDAKIRVQWARQLTLMPYLTGGVLSCAAGALNPVGPLLILISAAAASFGGNSGLAWMWSLLYNAHIPSSEFQMPEIERSRGWIIATVVLAIGFILGLGPGVRFHPSSKSCTCQWVSEAENLPSPENLGDPHKRGFGCACKALFSSSDNGGCSYIENNVL